MPSILKTKDNTSLCSADCSVFVTLNKFLIQIFDAIFANTTLSRTSRYSDRAWNVTKRSKTKEVKTIKEQKKTKEKYYSRVYKKVEDSFKFKLAATYGEQKNLIPFIFKLTAQRL